MSSRIQQVAKIGPFGHQYHHSSAYSNPHFYSSLLSSGSRSNHHHNDTTHIINIVNETKTTNRMMPQLKILLYINVLHYINNYKTNPLQHLLWRTFVMTNEGYI